MIYLLYYRLIFQAKFISILTMINNKNLLVTGGTGTFGKAFIAHILKKYNPKKIIIFSRDELKQYEISNSETFKGIKNIRFFLGDVRDLERLKTAMSEVDIVVHAAALKQVPAAEYNPIEFIKTNIIGAQNIIEASIYNNVSRVIALSTDKAVQPLNLYGATKLTSDKLFIAANHMYGEKKTRFAVTRYGNVIGSRGSVIPFFRDLINKKSRYLPITDINMTRFFISQDQATSFVVDNLERMYGGEIFVPKLPSVKITDLATAMSKNIKLKIIGKRPGEKVHEVMCPAEESYLTAEYKGHYVIYSHGDKMTLKKYPFDRKKEKGKFLKNGFEYSSNKNKNFLSIKQVEKLLKSFK